MASLGDDRLDSVLDDRRNLLNIIEERNRTLNKKCLLHRMVIVSKTSHSDCHDIGTYYEQMFKERQAMTSGGEHITGMMLLYPKHCVHVVEGPTEDLLDLCRELSMQESGHGHTSASKILVVSHDLENRLYQHWSYRVLDIEAPQVEYSETNESAESIVAEMLIQILKLGVFLARQPKVALKSTMDSLHDKVPELLPQQDLIGFLVNTDDPCITKPAEYLDSYNRPFENVLESERTWPMPVRVFPYN